MPQDKKQRFFTIKQFPNINFFAGTADRNTLKACYLEIKGTFETEEENKLGAVNSVCKQISQTISSNMNKNLFREEFLLSKDISDSFVFTGKSYTKLEYTFFMRRKTDFIELTNELNKICNDIYENNLKNNSKVKFHRELISKRNYSTKKNENTNNKSI